MGVDLEICVDSLASSHAAVAGGATRLELCSALAQGGLTPSIGMVRRVVALGAPVHVLIRPRPCDFVFTEEEITVIIDDIHECKRAGAAGVVVGALLVDGRIDVDAVRRFCQAAKPIEVTFHRAFDVSSGDPIEDIVALHRVGVVRLLTSGRSQSAIQGAALISSLVRSAPDGFCVMAGAGITVDNIGGLLDATGVRAVHASARSAMPSRSRFWRDGVAMGNDSNDRMMMVADQDSVSALKRICEMRA
ncbi:hypothetical protein PBRA_004828 [Plasmodiophora brassicae]|uniref:Copper homeostasis protein cutC homolog n=1 Tax=Plasmodiophora brassicae TaxID=37360 RepID=A0A0G4ILT2_PLABS|nr:hypothetical protein PBRA_004828 [Plasmodiophora brassicae]